MTDQTDRSETKGKDLLGLFLSGIGGLFFVSILLSFGDRTPKDVIWTAPVLGLIESIGRIPAMILTGGVAGLGTALFLGRGEFEVGRHLLGLAGLGLALALVFGGVVPTGEEGGMLGAALPGLVSGVTGRLIAAILGMCCLAAVVFFTWLQPKMAAAGAASPSLAPSLESRGGQEGVSVAEAAALTPPEPLKFEQPAPIPSSPYPPDARLEGRIPEGTQPLDGGYVMPQPSRKEERPEA